MLPRLVLFSLCLLNCAPAHADDALDAPFASMTDLPEAKVKAFNYEISLHTVRMTGYIMPGDYNGVHFETGQILIRCESPKRIPGDSEMTFVEARLSTGQSAVDVATTQAYGFTGEPEYPVDKPASSFRTDLHSLPFNLENELPLRIRFQDSTDHYLLRYADGKGIFVEPRQTANGTVVVGALPDWKQIEISEGKTVWRCNSLTSRAWSDGKLLWSTDIPMAGQPKSMSVLDEVLFITTTADHSFYVRKDSGKVVFYDKTILPGINPFEEILSLGRENMKLTNKYSRLEPFVRAAVILDDRRFIPFLIDTIDKGFGLEVKCMAIAALEKFNGNPHLWAPKTRKPGHSHTHWVGMDRVYPEKNRQAEIEKWRGIFSNELTLAE